MNLSRIHEARQTLNPRGGVWNRGQPDTRDGRVHFCIPPTRDGCHKEKPACSNGNYHIQLTSNPAHVRCDACAEWLKTNLRITVEAFA